MHNFSSENVCKIKALRNKLTRITYIITKHYNNRSTQIVRLKIQNSVEHAEFALKYLKTKLIQIDTVYIINENLMIEYFLQRYPNNCTRKFFRRENLLYIRLVLRNLNH